MKWPEQKKERPLWSQTVLAPGCPCSMATELCLGWCLQGWGVLVSGQKQWDDDSNSDVLAEAADEDITWCLYSFNVCATVRYSFYQWPTTLPGYDKDCQQVINGVTGQACNEEKCLSSKVKRSNFTFPQVFIYILDSASNHWEIHITFRCLSLLSSLCNAIECVSYSGVLVSFGTSF